MGAMATDQTLDVDEVVDYAGEPARSRSGMLILGALVAVSALGAGGFYAYKSTSTKTDQFRDAAIHTIAKSNLVVTVTEDGNVESAVNLELKCEVQGGTTILSIIPDGQQVKKGEELVRLESATIEENVDAQTIKVEQAMATKISSERDFSAAKIAFQDYLEGKYLQEMQTHESNITIAKENLRSAEDAFRHTERMARKGYVTPLQLESQKFAVERAKLDMALQETNKRVLQDFTKAKTLEELASKRDSAEAKMRAELAAYDLEVKKLQRLKTQLTKCVINAPQDGMVVYANDMMGARFGQQGPEIEEGAAVREQQSIIKLPDLSKMQVKVLVHESKIDLLRPSMPARIKIQDTDYKGSVIQVSTQPEAGNWFGGNVKEYAVTVKIEGTQGGLKPGMTAEVEILVTEKPDVISVPVQAIVEKGPRKFFAYVRSADGPVKRKLVLGSTNDTHIEVKDGLALGDQVILNPRTIVADASEDVAEVEVVDTTKKFGGKALKLEDGATDEMSPAAEEGASEPVADGSGKPGGPVQAVAADAPPAGEQGDKIAGGPGGPAGGGPGGPGAGGPGGPGGGGPGGAGGKRGMGAFKMPTFKDMDKDGDGKFVKEEIDPNAPGGAEGANRFFEMLDKDASGDVTPAEFKEVMDGFKKKMAEWKKKGGAGGPGGGGPGGPPM